MLKGIDISKYQGVVDWDSVKNSVDFAMIRSSLGSPDAGQTVAQYTDVKFARNRDEARRVGILHGFYHFSYSKINSPESEANCFCDVVGQLAEGEILALDLEGNLASNPVDWSLRFCNTVLNRTGIRPLIYMSKSVTSEHDWSSVINANYGLWVAHWGANQDATKENTPWPFVAMLQYADNGNISGMNPVDTDTFNGSADQFKKYGYQTPPVVVPVPTPEPIVEPVPEPVIPVVETSPAVIPETPPIVEQPPVVEPEPVVIPPVVTELPLEPVLPVEPIIIQPTPETTQPVVETTQIAPETTQDVNKTTDVVSIPSVDVKKPSLISIIEKEIMNEELKARLTSRKLWVAVLSIILLVIAKRYNEALAMALTYIGVQGVQDTFGKK